MSSTQMPQGPSLLRRAMLLLHTIVAERKKERLAKASYSTETKVSFALRLGGVFTPFIVCTQLDNCLNHCMKHVRGG